MRLLTCLLQVGSAGSHPGNMVFTLGVSRLEALRKVARLLDGDLSDQATPDSPAAPGSALVLRILALQVGKLRTCD